MAFGPAPLSTLLSPLTRDSGEEKEGAENQVVPALVAGYGDGTVRVFDVNSVEMRLKLHPHSVAVTAIAFAADGERLASSVLVTTYD